MENWYMNKKGFTLLELLVVVLIIGILAAIALPQYRLAVDKTRYASLMNITKGLFEANERFYLLNDRYSTDFGELDVDIQAKEIDNNSHTAYFDWGSCVLYYQREVRCTNNKNLNNQFVMPYSNGDIPSWNNKIICIALTTEKNSRYDKICQSFGKFFSEGTCSSGPCRTYIIRN